MRLLPLLLLALAATLATHPAQAAMQCKDMQGNNVDWWIAFKFPKLTGNYASGLGFAYMDPNTDFYVPQQDMTDPNTAIAQTLQQVYSAGSNAAYAMYNDEPANGPESETKGHCKGVLGYDSSNGFWLLHSTPRWPPPVEQGYQFPDDECDYGQSFLCMSFSTASFEDVAYQLTFYYPDIYSSNMPSALSSKTPTMASVFSGSHVAASPYTSLKQLTTLGGQTFYSFAKNSAWDSDLYQDLVAPYVKDDLRTETWQNGRGKMNSDCRPTTTYDVENISEVQIVDGVSWSSTKDHSKWCIASQSTKWACIGGINRQVSQANRAGGTMCFKILSVWNTMNTMVASTESC